MEKKTIVLSSMGDFGRLQTAYLEGWVKDEEVPYNPYGTDSIKIIHLVRYAEGELEGIKAQEAVLGIDKYRLAESIVKVPLESPGPDNQADKLISEGYEIINDYAKDVVLLKRKPQVVTPPEAAVAGSMRAPTFTGPDGSVAVAVEGPLAPPEEEVLEAEPVQLLVHPLMGETVTVRLKKASGEPVGVVEGAISPAEEPKKYERELLGCNECGRDSLCMETTREARQAEIKEKELWQCSTWKEREV